MLLVLQFYVYVVYPFVLLFWSLCCLYFFDIQIFITPFGIFKLLLPLSLDCPYWIASAVFSNAYLDIYSDLDFQHYPLFSVFSERGDFSFYRHWWIYWPSFFKLSFLNCHRNKEKGKITLSPWKIAKELWGHNYIYHKLTKENNQILVY
jgi:hypothetical protein